MWNGAVKRVYDGLKVHIRVTSREPKVSSESRDGPITARLHIVEDELRDMVKSGFRLSNAWWDNVSRLV